MRLAICLTFALAAVGAAAALAGDEEKVPLDQLPKAVLEAVKKRFPKAELVAASKEVENGKTEFEVSIKDNGKKADVTLTPDGKLLGIEKEIAVADLPKAVTEALAAKYPKADLKSAEELIEVKDGKETLGAYEVVLVTADKKTVEAVVSPKGQITKTETKDEKKKEEKK
jgi:hypothetical protein